MSYLQLNRLVILTEGIAVYDEKFHRGVNIIRGENGVGKSTISNAIYFVLGGDFVKWLPEIEKCDFVIAEINLAGAIITVKRQITRLSMQPMWIFYGDYEASTKNSIAWITHPYKRTKKEKSFSQVFFDALGYPEVETDDDEYITFNQALRLMYIDQISPLDELMKDIDFDSPLIRKTAADLLFGVYDNSLFKLQLRIKELRKSQSESESELKLLRTIYRNTDTNDLQKKVTDANDQLLRIDASLQNSGTIAVKLSEKKASKIEDLQKEIGDISENLKAQVNALSVFQYDKADSEEFISELENQVQSLNESEAIRSILGELHITYCPSCLQQTKTEALADHCELCKEPINTSLAKGQILRIKQQLEAQIRESNVLLQGTESKMLELNGNITSLKAELKLKQNQLNRVISDRSSDKDQRYEDLLVTKGKLIQQLTQLQDDLTNANRFWSIYNANQRLTNEIDKTTKLIDEKKENQRKNYQLVIQEVDRYAKKLLIKDGEYEAAFTQAGVIGLDFLKNTYSVDERNNFSASSQVILKNSIRFAIFFASLKLDFMRYPRFILCDNIEDKGMNQARSNNFQKNLVELAMSHEFKDTQFQIIFTTSMVEKTVDIDTYTIGEYYTPANKALKIPKAFAEKFIEIFTTVFPETIPPTLTANTILSILKEIEPHSQGSEKKTIQANISKLGEIENVAETDINTALSKEERSQLAEIIRKLSNGISLYGPLAAMVTFFTGLLVQEGDKKN